jgi:hypothetical protein
MMRRRDGRRRRVGIVSISGIMRLRIMYRFVGLFVNLIYNFIV